MENLEPRNSSKLSAKTIYINPEFKSLLQPHINPLFLYNHKINIHMNPQFLTNYTGSAFHEEIKCETPILCDTNIKKINIKTNNAEKLKTCKPHRYKLDNRPPNIQKKHNPNRYVKRYATYSINQDINTIKTQLKTDCNKTISFLKNEKNDAFKQNKTISHIYSFNKTSHSISNINNQYKLSSTKTTNLVPKSKYSHVNNVKQRSLKFLRKRLVKINLPCGIFQRIGKCVAFDHCKCPLLHDKSQVAICPRFLKGECKKSHCLLSHNSSLSKMPACKFYLQGVCVRKNCPYLHKKLSHKVEICKDFARGFCSLAEKCNKRHEFQLPLTKVKSSSQTLKQPQPEKRKLKTPCKDDHGIRYFDNTSIEANPLNLNLPAAKTERIKSTKEESGTDTIWKKELTSLPSFISIS